MVMIQEEINEVFYEAEKINVIQDGVKATYSNGENYFNTILSAWNELLTDSHLMPAFGVSINRETVKAMKEGLWVEFEFPEVMQVNEMPFEKLSVKVEKDYQGFNLNRYNAHKGYDGRCFYISLVDKDMSGFYGTLTDVLG